MFSWKFRLLWFAGEMTALGIYVGVKATKAMINNCKLKKELKEARRNKEAEDRVIWTDYSYVK